MAAVNILSDMESQKSPQQCFFFYYYYFFFVWAGVKDVPFSLPHGCLSDLSATPLGEGPHFPEAQPRIQEDALTVVPRDGLGVGWSGRTVA